MSTWLPGANTCGAEWSGGHFGLISAGQGLLQDLHASVSPEPPAGHLGQGVNRRREGGQGVEIRSAHPGSSRCSRDSALYGFLQCSFRPPLWGPSDSEMWGLQESPHCGLSRESGAWICLPTTQGPTWSLGAVPRQGRGRGYRDSDRDGAGIRPWPGMLATVGTKLAPEQCVCHIDSPGRSG